MTHRVDGQGLLGSDDATAPGAPSPVSPSAGSRDDDPELANILAAFHRPPRPPAPLLQTHAAASGRDLAAHRAASAPARAQTPEERRQGALLQLSKLVSEPTPLPPEPLQRDAATFLLPRTRHSRRRLAILAVAFVAVVIAAVSGAALRPIARVMASRAQVLLASHAPPVSVPIASTAAAAVRVPPFPAAAGAGERGRAQGRPSALPEPVEPGPLVPTAGRPAPDRAPPSAKLDPEYKRSM